MICPKCHGNGYWVEKLRALRQVRQCDKCDSQGEVLGNKLLLNYYPNARTFFVDFDTLG